MNLTLEILSDTFAICRLNANAPIPSWAQGEFVTITRTLDELSIVCRHRDVPDDIQCEAEWRCLRVAGKLEFTQIGIIASLTQVLSEANISVFVISTFDTDYLLVRKADLDRTIEALEEKGYSRIKLL